MEHYFELMKYLAAYLLASLAGKEPTADSLVESLKKANVEDLDDAQIKLVIDQLKGKKIEDVIAAGKERLSSVPTGGASAGASAAAGATEEAAQEAAEEEEEEESSSEGGFGGLF
ncbi:putative multi-domain containing protein [Aduncisulcus paluster]|uniref:Multi-domain containing protein n=1 Tax=Aduncisulcus paluster TaxID=2918883 RepID=A0ABQ5K566_9EUKA|nr:putative multi-domain containing protein [Aduncisulcus paluster]